MADSPFTRYANAIAMREGALRTDVPAVLNMTGTLSDIASKTGAPGALEGNEIPAVANLANRKSYLDATSRTREESSQRAIKQLPKYVSSYRNYLKWRYPSRYGGKTGTNYTTDFTQSGADIADIKDPFAPPTFR